MTAIPVTGLVMDRSLQEFACHIACRTFYVAGAQALKIALANARLIA